MEAEPSNIELRRTPKQSRSIKTVERLLGCAAVVLEGSGYDGFSMQSVADEAGMAIGTIYQYFPDKYAILQTLVERWYEKTESVQLTSYSTYDYVLKYAEVYTKEPGASALLDAIQAVPKLRAFDRSKVDEAIHRTATEFASGDVPTARDYARARVLTITVDSVLRAAIRLPASETALLINELERLLTTILTDTPDTRPV